MSNDLRVWGLRAAYLLNFGLSHAAAWLHMQWWMLFFFGVAFLALSKVRK